jgi:hypothetical protein
MLNTLYIAELCFLHTFLLYLSVLALLRIIKTSFRQVETLQCNLTEITKQIKQLNNSILIEHLNLIIFCTFLFCFMNVSSVLTC